MSSILKALKKLEEEQAGQADSQQRPRAQFIAPAGPGRRSMALLAGGAGFGVLLAGGAFWLFGNSGAAPARVETAPPATVAVTAAAPAQTLPPAPAMMPTPAVAPVVTPPSAAKSLPAASAATRQAVAPLPARPPQVAATRPEPAGKQPAATTVAPAAVAEPVGQVHIERREIPLPGQLWAAPQLTVSDILPSAAGERMAIVNGLPVMEGTMVENAQVERIFDDRVRFVIDGKVVEVRPAQGP